MILDFFLIWIIAFVGIAGTSLLAVTFVLVVSGIVERLDPNEKGELQSFSTIVLGIWSVGLSLVISYILFILQE